jgi:hypothetical protein
MHEDKKESDKYYACVNQQSGVITKYSKGGTRIKDNGNVEYIFNERDRLKRIVVS